MLEGRRGSSVEAPGMRIGLGKVDEAEAGRSIPPNSNKERQRGDREKDESEGYVGGKGGSWVGQEREWGAKEGGATETPMFSARLLSIDACMVQPTPHLDELFSSLHGTAIKQVQRSD